MNKYFIAAMITAMGLWFAQPVAIANDGSEEVMVEESVYESEDEAVADEEMVSDEADDEEVSEEPVEEGSDHY